MQARKIIDLSLRESPTQFRHTLYSLLLTYDDATQKEVSIHGNELAFVLNKNFESIDLQAIYISGEFSGKFELDAYYKGYFGGLKHHQEILDIKDVIDLFNERGHLVGLDAKKNLLKHTIPDADKNDREEKTATPPSPITPNTSEQKVHKKWITKSYNPKQYMFRSLYDKNNEPIYNAIEINCLSDDDGAYITYRLIGMDRKEASGTIRQTDLPDVPFPHSVTEIMNDNEYDTWLNRILNVAAKRGQTSADHIPPEKEHEDFYRPYVQPKGYLVQRGERMVYDDSLWQHLRQAGLFAAKKVTDILCPAKQSQVFYDQGRNNLPYINEGFKESIIIKPSSEAENIIDKINSENHVLKVEDIGDRYYRIFTPFTEHQKDDLVVFIKRLKDTYVLEEAYHERFAQELRCRGLK